MSSQVDRLTRGPAHAVVRTALSIALALLVYARALPLGFLSDDFDLVERIANGPLFVGWAGFFRPVTVASLRLDHALYGTFAPGFHLTNVVLHGLCGALVASLLERMLERFAVPRARTIALLSAFSFIAMPSHTEAVTWVAGRGDLLASVFGLACALAFTHTSTPLARWSCPVLLGLALLSKESAVVFPPVLATIAVATSRARGEPISRETKRTLLGVAIVLVGYLALRTAVLTDAIGGYGVSRLIPTHPTELASAIGKSALRTFVPATSIFRGRHGAVGLALIASLALVIVVTTRFREHGGAPSRRLWLVATSLTCFVIAVSPTLMIGLNIRDTMGERFLYLPSAFVVVLPMLAIFERPGARYAHGLCIAVIALEALALDRVNVRWETASALAERILDDLVTRDPTTTAILNLPDNHRGAYVFRNALGSALALRGADAAPSGPFVRHGVASPERAYRVVRHDTTLDVLLGASDDVVLVNAGAVVVRTANGIVSLDLSGLPSSIETLLVFEGGAHVFRAVPVGARGTTH